MYGARRTTLNAAPVNVAEGLRMHLFEKLKSVVLTSATLSTGNADSVIVPRRANPNGPVSDTGFQPVRGASHVEGLRIRQGAYLPHWNKDAATYAVNFRLADSLPKHVLEEWVAERDDIIVRARQQQRPLTETERDRLRTLFSERVEAFLDQGHGECVLADESAAAVVADALKHFDGQRYRLIAWCVMPNHVHVVVQPLGAHTLESILHSWKSFTASAINKGLSKAGTLWMPESYDHLIRDQADLDHAVKYTWENPENAGWTDWEWRGIEKKAAAVSKQPVASRTMHGLEARVTDGAARSRTTSTTADPFAYVRARLGLINERTLQVGSPFDYASQATLYLEENLPDPNDNYRFLPAACDRILHYVRKTHGGAFVLFTSYRMLAEAAARLKPHFDSLGLPLLVHGQGAPRKVLLERFRSIDNAVLFGTSSFWQGIDVQGDKLRNVIITKLPFAVPDEPVIEARLDAIKRSGGNPFMEYSVPEAVIKLKQGFGRLIRSKTDTGIVVILDSRVKTKRYGKLFLDALPGCKTVTVR